MNLYFIVLFENIEEDRGETINLLIDKKIISLKDLQDRLIEVNNPEYIISAIRYIPNLINDEVLETIVNLNNSKIIYKFLEIIDETNLCNNGNNKYVISIKSKLNLLHRLEGLLIDKQSGLIIKPEEYNFLFSDIKIKKRTNK